MKILCSTYEFPPIGGGGANVAFPLARTLRSRGHTMEVVTSGMSDLRPVEQVDGVNIHRVSCVRRHRHFTTTAELMTYLLPAYRKSAQLHRQSAFDINHTHFALPTGAVSYLLYRKYGLPYVTTIHGSDIPGYNPDRFQIAHILSRPLWKQIILNSARIVCASNFLKELLECQIDVPVDIIRNGFDPQRFPPRHAEKKNRILVVSRMFQRKGVQYFIEALRRIDHDWEVVVAGDGPYLPTLREQARRNGLNIDFVGYVQGDRLDELYSSAKIFVFPSLQENFPVVLLEAMQSGCAIITTNAQGCGEVIGNAGITITPERPDEIRNALTALIEDDTQISTLRRRALERVKLFAWPRIAEQYESLMRDTLLSRAGRLRTSTTNADGRRSNQ